MKLFFTAAFLCTALSCTGTQDDQSSVIQEGYFNDVELLSCDEYEQIVIRVYSDQGAEGSLLEIYRRPTGDEYLVTSWSKSNSDSFLYTFEMMPGDDFGTSKPRIYTMSVASNSGDSLIRDDNGNLLRTMPGCSLHSEGMDTIRSFVEQK